MLRPVQRGIASAGQAIETSHSANIDVERAEMVYELKSCRDPDGKEKPSVGLLKIMSMKFQKAL